MEKQKVDLTLIIDLNSSGKDKHLKNEIIGNGGFHFVDLIITELKDHMICYKLECSH